MWCTPQSYVQLAHTLCLLLPLYPYCSYLVLSLFAQTCSSCSHLCLCTPLNEPVPHLLTLCLPCTYSPIVLSKLLFQCAITLLT
jgi:hypothetical protein